MLSAGVMSASNRFERVERGIIVTPSDTRNCSKVRLEVLGEKLIHVSATPENEFGSGESLIVLPELPNVSYTVAARGDSVMLKTAALEALVSLKTGEVTFKDNDGRTILSEDNDGRKFNPVEVEGTKGYSVLR